MYSYMIMGITGTMFAGKSSYLIETAKSFKLGGYNIGVFKHKKDNRYNDTYITTHNGETFPAQAVKDCCELQKQVNKDVYDAVFIDEVQFFDKGLINLVQSLAFEGKTVVFAGLDKNYRGDPFGPIGDLLAIADRIIKLSAVCVDCQGEANISWRVTNEMDEVVVGTDNYIPLCRQCILKRQKQN